MVVTGSTWLLQDLCGCYAVCASCAFSYEAVLHEGVTLALREMTGYDSKRIVMMQDLNKTSTKFILKTSG